MIYMRRVRFLIICFFIFTFCTLSRGQLHQEYSAYFGGGIIFPITPKGQERYYLYEGKKQPYIINSFDISPSYNYSGFYNFTRKVSAGLRLTHFNNTSWNDIERPTTWIQSTNQNIEPPQSTYSAQLIHTSFGASIKYYFTFYKTVRGFTTAEVNLNNTKINFAYFNEEIPSFGKGPVLSNGFTFGADFAMGFEISFSRYVSLFFKSGLTWDKLKSDNFYSKYKNGFQEKEKMFFYYSEAGLGFHFVRTKKI